MAASEVLVSLKWRTKGGKGLDILVEDLAATTGFFVMGALRFSETEAIIDTMYSLMVVLLPPKPNPLSEIFM